VAFDIVRLISGSLSWIGWHWSFLHGWHWERWAQSSDYKLAEDCWCSWD